MKRLFPRTTAITPIIALAALVGTFYTRADVNNADRRGDLAAAVAAPSSAKSNAGSADDLASRFAPKATLKVVKGEKTIAPTVPAPVVRAENCVVEYELTVKETSQKIAPDVTYRSLWTFDGVAPGPVMRVKQGDVIRFTLKGDSNNLIGHNIDFHFVSGA